ncbi:MAG: cytochrome c biogenesis protein CcsA [Prevotella sp.]|nr:cytochrome c biogenesis protein CcsA [Prevotella sp.]
MIWTHFISFALVSTLFWLAGAFFAWKNNKKIAISSTFLGLLVFFSYLMLMWRQLERPPLRTMGETRLWYSVFLSLAGLVVYVRWRFKWILTFTTLMAVVFITVNLLKPEIHTKTLMPALQSPWFAPHVIVYMMAYALLGASAMVAVWILTRREKPVSTPPHSRNPVLPKLDRLVQAGLSFLTVGMLFGALWAKEAWGHYWSWDPKETWAAATWLSYLVCLHYRLSPKSNPRVASWMLIVCFLLLQVCWWGINLLPSAQGASIHVY